MFRKAESRDIDAIHQVLVAEAEQGRFDRRLAIEPHRTGLRENLDHIRKHGRRLDDRWGRRTDPQCDPLERRSQPALDPNRSHQQCDVLVPSE